MMVRCSPRSIEGARLLPFTSHGIAVRLGYKIVFVPFDRETHEPKGVYEDFVRGFLTDPSGPTAWGRPVGITVMKDGSLLFADDGNNRIYRVSYDEK